MKKCLWHAMVLKHCDYILQGALNRYFGGKDWHFINSSVAKVHRISRAVDSNQRMLPKFSMIRD